MNRDFLTDTLSSSGKRLRSLRPTVSDASSDLVDSLLDRAGLQRKSTIADRALWLGLGAVAGGLLALLFAPSSGKETRRKLGDGVRSGTDAIKERASTLSHKSSQIAGKIQNAAEGVVESGRQMADEALQQVSSLHDGHDSKTMNGRRKTTSDTLR